MAPDQHVINKVDIPAVWLFVLLEFFTKLPWPGIAAFLASVYTLFRIVGMAIKWWRQK